MLSYVLLTDEEWPRFKEAFNKAYPVFFVCLKEFISRVKPRLRTFGKHRIDWPDDTILEDYILRVERFSVVSWQLVH